MGRRGKGSGKAYKMRVGGVGGTHWDCLCYSDENFDSPFALCGELQDEPILCCLRVAKRDIAAAKSSGDRGCRIPTRGQKDLQTYCIERTTRQLFGKSTLWKEF